MAKKTKHLHPDDPLYHRDHSRPVTRRDLLKQGFISGTGMVMGGGLLNVLAYPQYAHAALSPDIDALAASISGCELSASGPGKIPFICFDLGGGANLASSNVIVGADGQMDPLAEGGYRKMGVPAAMIPGTSSAALVPADSSDNRVAGTPITAAVLNNSTNADFTNDELGLLFHQDSPMLYGILERFSTVSRAANQIDGAVIPARSDNDTGNNPHNPMYGIAKAGAIGDVVTLIGSQNSDSGARSMAPAALIDTSIRPTKVDRPSDVTGMVDVGDLTGVLSTNDVIGVMESMTRISHKKLKNVDTLLANNQVVKDQVRCNYMKAANIADLFAGRAVDPAKDPVIVDQGADPTTRASGAIFSRNEFNSSGEFRKTASVMKMVLDGNAGAGSISMGGYDYHTGDRSTGENRDLRAGRCIGACLEYAARTGKQLMVYVYSDGSVASNGALDGSAPGGNDLGGRGKGQWTGDNSSTASSFFLVFKPGSGIIQINNNGLADPRQIGRFTTAGSVVTSATPAANNVNLLVNTVIANYMSLNGDLANFGNAIPNNGLGDSNSINSLVTFGPL